VSQRKKPKKAGRPQLPKGNAKVGTLRVRFEPDDLKLVTAAAKDNSQTVSEWIRKAAITAAEVQMFTSTLHDAIKIVLMGRESRTATTSEISAEIERSGSYTRKDGKPARVSQINARVRWHPEFEFVEPGVVRLISNCLANRESNGAA
jgi:hypothetical protein